MNRGVAVVIALCCCGIAYVWGHQDGFAAAVVDCPKDVRPPVVIHSNPAYVDCVYEYVAPARTTFKRRINRKSH